MLPKLVAENNIESFLNSFDNVLTDCDGVLWTFNTVIPGANISLNKLRSMGKRIFFITNNSTKSRQTLVDKCEKLGFIANEDEAISTSYVVAQLLKSRGFKRKVYILGSNGIGNELDLVGIPHIGIGPLPTVENLCDLQEMVNLDPEVGAVIVGFDMYFNVPKVMHAASYLKNPECLFFGTNTDEQFPCQKDNLIFPGTGVLVKAVETACSRTAEVVGKPSPRMFTVISEKYGLDPNRTIMIGDRCNTDIMLGKNCGLKTLVVLTGSHKWSDMVSWSQSSDPEEHNLLADYYLPSLGDLDKLIP